MNKYLEKIAAVIAIKPSKQGALHKDLGIPEGEKISDERLSSALKSAKSSGNKQLAKRIVFAQNSRKWKHK